MKFNDRIHLWDIRSNTKLFYIMRQAIDSATASEMM
jgi:hypothetical protein